jgi:hypothetical protein
MSFNCFNSVTVKPRVGVSLIYLLNEMKALSSKAGLPVIAEVNGEKIEITAITNIKNVLDTLESK